MVVCNKKYNSVSVTGIIKKLKCRREIALQ